MSDTSTAVVPFEGDMDPGAKRAALAMWKHAQQLAKSNLAGDLKGKPEDVFSVIAFADQFGIAPGNAIQMIWIIKGRLVPRSEFLAAVTRRAGHELRFEESSSERCTVAIRRREDDFWQRVTFTLADAQRAKLADKEIWLLYTADMLCHATVRRAVKRICPDVLLGRDIGGDEGVPVDRYRAPEVDDEKVVDVEIDWDDDPEDPDPVATPHPPVDEATDEIPDAELVEPDPPAADEAADAAAARDRAMKSLMATCGKAFPEKDATKGTKAHRQRILRRAAQFAVLGEHRSASDLTTDELKKVEQWVYRYFLDDGSTVRMTYEIRDGDVVRFGFDDKAKYIEPAPEPTGEAA